MSGSATAGAEPKVREEAHLIQAEVRCLIEEVSRLRERALKLAAHFKLAEEDVDQIMTAAGKTERRARRIDRLDFGPEPGELAALPFGKAAE
jgi:DNA recombination protein RmuC